MELIPCRHNGMIAWNDGMEVMDILMPSERQPDTLLAPGEGHAEPDINTISLVPAEFSMQ